MTHDAEARRIIREELDTTLVVEAAAGTGKTTELIERLVAVIRSGRGRLEEIIAVTFTEMAAGEMKLRLRTRLDEARGEASDDERTRFEAALAALETARIGTIHGLCSDLLRERPVEAGIDPSFTVLAEADAAALLERAFDGWFQSALEAPPEGTQRTLAHRSGDEGPRGQLIRAARDLIERRDYDGPWERPPFDRDPQIDALVEQLRGLAARVEGEHGRHRVTEHLRRLGRFCAALDERERHLPRDHDRLEAELAELAGDRDWDKRSAPRKVGGIDKEVVLGERDEVRGVLQGFVEAAEMDRAAALHVELQEVVRRYVRLLRKAGAVDFLDLLLRTRDLLVNDPSVRRDLQQRVSHVFVDEFQDTDPLQAEILLLLSADDPDEADASRVSPLPGKMFVVGDPKQAIYRFRRADVQLYQRVKDQLVAAGGVAVELSTSFRAQPAVQSVVNAAFEPLMQGADDGSQARYVALQPHRPAGTEHPSVIALPVPDPYGVSGRVTKGAVNTSTPGAVGAFVDWLVQHSGWTVEERGKQVPLLPRHVCLLFTRLRSWQGDVTRPYVRALEDRGVSHVLVGGRSLHSREEVIALRALVEAIEHPEDRLHVYAVLRGPLLSFSDDQLLAYRHARGPLSPIAPREGEVDDPVFRSIDEALDELRRLHRGRNHRPIADTLVQWLDHTRAHAGIAHWPNGEQALANVHRVVEHARRFDRRATSFRAFAHWLDQEAEQRRAGEAPVVEEGTEGVRIMSVHRAKGLEFPVVILCDPTAPRTSTYPTRWIDPESRRWVSSLARCEPRELRRHRTTILAHDDAERVRVAYVAVTRARDVLVVPCVGDEAVDGWVAALHPALYPERGAVPRMRTPPGCPRLGSDSVRDRHPGAVATPDDTVTPGLHRPRAGKHLVTWWSPENLELDPEPVGGLRQQQLLEKAPDPAATEAARHRYVAWRDEGDRLRAEASVPTHPTVTVTALSHETDAPATVEVQLAERDDQRPHGPRFGTLVHTLLAELPLAPPPSQEAVLPMARAVGRLLDAPKDEVDAAAAAVASALRHPLFDEVRTSSDVRREQPLTVPLDDGRTAEGVVDLAFRRGDGWVVVDFKTDRGELPPAYAHQVRRYAEAIAAATGLAAEPLILQL